MRIQNRCLQRPRLLAPPHPPQQTASIRVHAAPLGKAHAILPPARRHKDSYPQRPLVIPAPSLTGYPLAKERMPFADAIIFSPLDWAFSVRRVLDAVNPPAVI